MRIITKNSEQTSINIAIKNILSAISSKHKASKTLSEKKLQGFYQYLTQI